MYGQEEAAMSSSRAAKMASFISSPQQRTSTTTSAQWGVEETREMIRLRGHAEKMMMKTNKSMSKIKNQKSSTKNKKKGVWEVVAEEMSERGFLKSAHQCKSKWKNLVTLYKGKEISDIDSSQDFPYFEELQEVFRERAKNMQQLSEAGSSRSKKKASKGSGDWSSDEFSNDNDENFDGSDEERAAAGNYRKRKAEGISLDKSLKETSTGNMGNNNSSEIKEMLAKFFQQQQKMDMEWREIIDRRFQERQLYEQEWRQVMERFERERLMLEQAWREREEQRRMREESRAEKRDTLLTTLLNKLINEK